MKTFLLLSILLPVIGFLIIPVSSHGRQVRPPGRSSLWRFSQFADMNPPVNYDDNQLYCGGLHQKDNPGRQCGVCGDPISQKRPRDNEYGGRFYKGIITAEYKSGDVILVAAEVTAPHFGFMEWRLCTNPKWETQDCFDRHVLPIADGSGTKLTVGNEAGFFWARVKLPENISCDQCVIQWNYRAGNNWGFCSNGDGRLGCGAQETFRGCSDVRIVPRTPTKT